MEEIERYLIREQHVDSEVVRGLMISKILKYADIAEGFERWLKKRDYDDGLVVGGYTALDIYNMAPFLDGIGVYNFLVTLRDDPERARLTIEQGFPVK